MSVSFANPDALFTSRQVAEYRHKTENTLAVERCLGRGPRFIRDGKRVLYRAADLAEYLAANTVEPAKAGAPARD